MKKEFPDNIIDNLKAILTKGLLIWMERNNIPKDRIEHKVSINQSKLRTEVFIYYIIKPKKKDE